MLTHSRRFTVWLVSFFAVMVVYFFYNRMSRTPPISTNDLRQLGEGITDVCDSNGGVGMVGGVGVGVVKNARYTKLNKQKQLESEFGFEELLHKDGNDWEIKKPYVKIYRRGFECVMTGDRAQVTVDGAGREVTPSEGTLSGNVIIRVIPKRAEGIGEAVIYLDDVKFVGEKSMFYTPGIVEVVSDEVQLEGKGLELVYDGDAERLELLKIQKLKSINIKQWSKGTLFGPESQGRVAAEGKTGKIKEEERGQQYRCVLDKNVVIETEKERLVAQVLVVDGIFVGSEKDDSHGQGPVGDEPGKGAAGAVGGRESIAASGEEASDIAISCDGGIVIRPAEAEIDDKRAETAAMDVNRPSMAKADGKTTFYGRRIDYNASTGGAVAVGPAEITFDVKPAAEDENEPAKVTVTAQKQTRFEPASNRVLFEGDCRCTVSQAEGDAVRDYIVLADSLEVDLSQTGGGESPAVNVRRLTASGGQVRLASTKKMGEQLLGGVEMKCSKMDYEVESGDFFAEGPGLIKVDNSRTDEPQKGLGRFSLRRNCYAFLRNFDSLKFDGRNDILVADSKAGSLLMDYFPVAAEGKGDEIAVTASHIEAQILETAEGRTELGGLVAKGAVSYEDKDVQFAGSEFVYDAENSVINVKGSAFQPCIFNGSIVDALRYDLKTGKGDTRIKGPGALK